MYVDDTYMLHWPPSPHTSPEELIEHVQQATMDWGNLTQASGGILKAGNAWPILWITNLFAAALR
jgi:hypothetical protein